MDTSGRKWFVEEFQLRSPVDEFREFSQLEIERLRNENPRFSDSIHRAAVELVLAKLRPGRRGGGR